MEHCEVIQLIHKSRDMTLDRNFRFGHRCSSTIGVCRVELLKPCLQFSYSYIVDISCYMYFRWWKMEIFPCITVPVEKQTFLAPSSGMNLYDEVHTINGALDRSCGWSFSLRTFKACLPWALEFNISPCTAGSQTLVCIFHWEVIPVCADVLAEDAKSFCLTEK